MCCTPTPSEAVDEIESVELAELVNGTVTRAENDNKNEDDAKALTIDGTRYTDSYMVAGEKLGDISVDEEYNVYLDSYGYMIYVERIDEIGDYALLYNIDSGSLFNSNKAALIFADGTSAIVNTAEDYSDVTELNYDFNGDSKVDSDDQTGWNNSYGSRKAPVIVTYRVDDDNVYTLRAVRGYQGVTNVNGNSNASVGETDMLLVNDKAGITGLPESPVTANSATTFVVRDPADRNYDKIGDWTSYTGIKNAPSIDIRDLDTPATRLPADDAEEQADVYYYCKNGRMVTIMFIVPDEEVVVEDGVNKNIYLSDRDVSNLIHDTDYSVSFYEYPAVVDGEPTTVKVASTVKVNGVGVGETAAGQLGNELFGRYTTNKDGIITSLTSGTAYVDGAEQGIVNDAVGIDRVSKEYTVLVGKNATGYDFTITVDEDADIFYVDEDGDVNVSSYNAIAIDEDDLVYAVVDDYMVQTLVIFEVDTKNNAATPVIDAHPSNVTVTVGEDATLSVKAHSTDKGELSYQWIECTSTGVMIREIPGATADTYKPDTSVAGTRYYACNVTNTNEKVLGTETATATTALVSVTVNNAPAAKMYVTINYQLADGTFVDSTVVTVTDDGTEVRSIAVPALTGYTLRNSTVMVPFVANSTPERPVVVTPVAEYDVTLDLSDTSMSNWGTTTQGDNSKHYVSIDKNKVSAVDGTVTITITHKDGGSFSSAVTATCSGGSTATKTGVPGSSTQTIVLDLSNATGDVTIKLTK